MENEGVDLLFIFREENAIFGTGKWVDIIDCGNENHEVRTTCRGNSKSKTMREKFVRHQKRHCWKSKHPLYVYQIYNISINWVMAYVSNPQGILRDRDRRGRLGGYDFAAAIAPCPNP